MPLLKSILLILSILAMLAGIPYFLLYEIAEEQGRREEALLNKMERCRVGQYCKFNGDGFLKMSEVKK